MINSADFRAVGSRPNRGTRRAGVRSQMDAEQRASGPFSFRRVADVACRRPGYKKKEPGSEGAGEVGGAVYLGQGVGYETGKMHAKSRRVACVDGENDVDSQTFFILMITGLLLS
ncbi:hypothetical protein GWI33_012127 [Rhynchophorus ferrugineus]|uniref:Uncharacterized protein n=1 Tax=Rhynchophorus ferrugineus TaxID=354439 RepID=A0A834MCQ8_RHYFE|nr:hypothetical protein GWI33_012127 [Rhynchophorus ferrugineus]